MLENNVVTFCTNTCTNNTKKYLSTFSVATIFVIASLSFLVLIDSTENAYAIIVSNPFDPLESNLVGGGGIIVGPADPTKIISTFNPMFSECKQGKVHTEAEAKAAPRDELYRWEVAKYAITAELGDKDKLKSKDFSLDIFADMVNDDAKFDSKDYPYKAEFKTKKDGDTSLNIKEFMTLCADIVDVTVASESKVNLDKSEALKELGFDD